MNQKEMAALSAVELVEDGQILGLGTGSTVYYAIKEIGRRVKEEGLDVIGIPTSIGSEKLAVECGIPLATLQDYQEIDLDIDGTDQVDEKLEVIKGGGGAHFREKLVAICSKRLVIIADETKLVKELNMPVPIEVLPFAWKPTSTRLMEIGGNPNLRLNNGEPFVTDNKNFILDTDFGTIGEPKRLHDEINSIIGVVENGIFTGLASEVHAGTSEGVKIIKV
ncbi:MAG TPA: ribose-5-phosphate isomerase RpiA [Nitrospirae bacterium]|nr:ribose-5-phosphate isomerase RpiA [Nitrospirota bacterium]